MELTKKLPKIFVSENSLLQIPSNFLNIQTYYKDQDYCISISTCVASKPIVYKLLKETYDDINKWIRTFDI